MTTDNQVFDLVAAEGLRLSFTPIRDWTMLHPELRGTPFQLYAIMRSLVIEKTGDQSSRRITLDQLCWLLPGVNGKPTSLTVVKDALRALDRLGLVTNPDSERLVTSTGDRGIKSHRRFQINDLPPDGFRGWRNAWDKLDAYRENWRTDAPKPPAIGIEHPLDSRNSDCRADQGESNEPAGHLEGRNSDRDGRNSVHRGRNSVRQPADDQRKRAPNKSLKKGSLSTVATGAPEADPSEHREREDLGESNTPDPADPIVNAWIDSWSRTHGVPHPVKTPEAIRSDVHELLAEGIDAELLRLAAADMAKNRGWNSLHTHLKYFTPPASPGQAPDGSGSMRTAADCRWCDDFGWYEHENGIPARCKHPDDPPPGYSADANTRSAA